MSLPYGCQMTFPLLDCVPVQPLFLFVSSCVDFFFVCVWKGVHTAKNGFQHFYLKFVVSKACILLKKKKKKVAKQSFLNSTPFTTVTAILGGLVLITCKQTKEALKIYFF